MHWIKSNKFLAGFFGFMAVGVAVLGYLLYSYYSDYSDVSASYDKEATELVRLQGMVPYPDEVSLKKYTEQKELYAKDLADLRTTLASWNKHLEPMTPPQFQEELKEAAADFTTRAADAGMKVTQENFYLGFDEYRESAPSAEAASPLDRQLKGAQVLLNTLLESRVNILTSFTRKPLPEEQDTSSETPSANKAAPLVTYFPFDIKFTAGQSEVRRFLNSIVRNKTQFFVIRSIVISNSKSKGPPRTIEAPETAGLNLPDGPVFQSTGTANSIQFILGKETVSVVMRVEIVQFAEPPKGP